VKTAANTVVRSIAVLAVVFAALFAIPSQGRGGEAKWLPKPARGQGEHCVADTAWMRRNHPSVLMHQRDATVHDGIRTPRFSLKGCINCHAVKGADGKPVTVASPQHFCRTCHDYAAVQIDCFECHASRPVTAAAANAAPIGRESADVAALAHYARSLGQ
jgi:predicted CXXCH cytochrome family protein